MEKFAFAHVCKIHMTLVIKKDQDGGGEQLLQAR